MSLDDSFALAKADISITVNGKILQRTVEMRTLLIDFLRDQAGLTGPRIGCDEGACGACTVSLDGKIIKSCLCLAIEADCCDVTTVEALGSRQNLARLQEAFRACHAVQCGYCTSGMLMAASALLDRAAGKILTEEMIRDSLIGNMCRCTGYTNIIQAIKVAAGQAPSLIDGYEANLAGTHIGRCVARVEDARLLTGGGRYADDFNEPGQVHLAVVGATRAHALIKALSTANAKAMPGVVEIYTGADAAKVCGPMPPTMDTFGIKLPRRMAIAFDKVVFFGEPVALVLAETPAQAEDAAAAVAVEYEDLPVTIDGEQSAAITDPADPRLLYPEWKTNLQIDYPFAIGDVDSIFASADLVVSDIIRSQRYGAQPMEARGVIAFYDSREGTLRVRASTQIPHQARMFFAAALSIPESLIQILVGDVGGGFGAKLGVDAEYLPVIATRLLGRPVKWIEPRSSWIATAPQARDFVTRVRAAFDRDGKFKAMDVDVIGDMGCDGAERAGGLGMPVNGAVYAPGAYRLEAYRFRSRAVVTNKPPYGAYRGYGKDIANLAVERMMEKAALGLKMDPIEIRRRNLVDAYPYQLPSGPILENGSGRECLDRLLALMSPSELRAGQAEARGAGRYLGFGISSYIEPAGAAFPGSMFQNYEAASIRVNADGTVRVYTGMVSLGQGIETVYAQVAADLLGCRPTDVTVSWGDTDAGVFGSGTYSSRGAMYSVGALEKAAKLIRPRLMHVASKLLERPVGDLKLHDSIVTSKETNKSCTLKDIAYAVYFQPGAEIVLDGADSVSLEAIGSYRHPQVSWKFDELGRAQLYPSHPNGAMGALVEVDPQTGGIKILKIWVVSDHGVVLNPMILDGQITGSILQQIGGTLYEQFLFEPDGRPLLKTLKEYGMPTIWAAPEIEIEHVETRSPATGVGAKGAGEDGSIATTTVLLAAVEDALRPFGVSVSESPLTPWSVVQMIWNAAQENRNAHQV